MEQWKKVVLLSGLLVIATILFGFITFFPIFKAVVRQQTSLRVGNPIRGFYLKLPIALDFCVYFFNVSNPLQVQNTAAKPILKQVGPYCYETWKEKIVVDENEEEDSLTYKPSDKYFYNQNKSGTLTQDDYVTILHPLLVGMINAAAAESSAAIMSIVNKAVKSIFQHPESIYLTGKVRDILFDGMLLNCSSEEFTVKAVCQQIKMELPGLKEPEENLLYFSLFGTRNGTMETTFKILRGINNIDDLGRLVECDGKKQLDIWSGDECNQYKGTDGWIFPPFTDETKGMWAFSSDLCRNIHAKYVDSSTMKGISVKKFSGTLNDPEHNPEDLCYCPTPESCLRRGVLDLSKCMKVPVYATLPHFLDTDEKYLKEVEGLEPIREKHEVHIYLEWMTSVPIEAKKRMQLNFQVQPVQKVELMQTVPTVLHPVFWVEEGVELKGELLRMIANIMLLLKIVDVLRYTVLVAGIGGIGYGGYLYSKSRKSVKINTMQKGISTIAMTTTNSNSSISSTT